VERRRERQREKQRESPHIDLPVLVMDVSFAAD